MRQTPLWKKRPYKKKTLLEKLHRQLWLLFSKYVRKKSNGVCFICHTQQDWREMDASHYIHGRLDYSEINIQSCCVRCNRYLHGNLGRYAERLIERYGGNVLVELRREADQIKKWMPQELEEKIAYYQEIIKKYG